MSIETWWPRLSQAARDSLIADNGDVVPPHLVAEIVRAGGVITPDARWVGHQRADGFLLSDEAIDWIDAVANGEVPEPPDDGRA